ncbi:MAG: heat-inducible transcriptional repressor HrcA [Acidobacteriota bacterium]|jgi:heat-inducible transcriptional repressor|nr:heat-inducible transcriptional repressor HrcA [Acidobacteriota bacterium]
MTGTGDFLTNDRFKEILHWVIATFVVTGKPVGSRSVARHSSEQLSAATVRNIMADLEEMGYLHQPHASAGRVPTDKAYRFYVDYLMKRCDLSPGDRVMIEKDLLDGDSAEHMMARASQVLSRISKHVGIVVSPPISQVALEHIHFTKLADNRILVILASRSGMVQNRIIHYEDEVFQAELDRSARYIEEHFRNLTLAEIHNRILQMIHQEQALYDKFTQQVIALSAKAFSGSENAPRAEVYLDGASNLITTPEFSDINRMKLLFETIGQKSRLATLLSRCIENDDTQEVRITIGAENSLPGIEDCALITSRYVVDENTHGTLGILGPTRMEYARAVSLVDYVARIFGRVLETGNRQ